MDKKIIDLHCHSIFSDGSDTPEELVKMALKKGLSALALTDHDTVSLLFLLISFRRSISCRTRSDFVQISMSAPLSFSSSSRRLVLLEPDIIDHYGLS